MYSSILTVAIQNGIVFLHLSQVISVSGSLLLQYGQGVRGSSSISWSLVLGGFLTIASIFLLYFASTCILYSGRISIAAKLNAACFSPARWHSITVDVKIGTISKTKQCFVTTRCLIKNLYEIQGYSTTNSRTFSRLCCKIYKNQDVRNCSQQFKTTGATGHYVINVFKLFIRRYILTGRKFRYIIRNSYQHPSASQMVISFNVQSHEDVRM